MKPDQHPILECPPCTLEERVRWLEMHLAMLWDQVWWMNLPHEQREEYKAQGFSDPIDQFYGRENILDAFRGR